MSRLRFALASIAVARILYGCGGVITESPILAGVDAASGADVAVEASPADGGSNPEASSLEGSTSDGGTDAGNGCVLFEPAVTYGAGGDRHCRPTAIATGDFDDDGKLDLAVAKAGCRTANESLGILLGHGDGTFVTAVSYGTAGLEPDSLALGDFNGDRILDMAFAASTTDQVGVLLGNGDGTFESAQAYSAGPGPSSITTGDFNDDGRLDLVVANTASGVSVLLGNGDGTFAPAVSFAVNGAAHSVTSGDFNGDGELDLATDGVAVLLGRGNGTFQAVPAAGLWSVGGSSVVARDFDGDGKLDLAVATNESVYRLDVDGSGGGGSVAVLLGYGDGSFQGNTNFGVESDALSVTTGDFDEDGKLDLAVSARAGGLSVLLGSGGGTFQPAMRFASGGGWVTTGDFSGDGKLDLATDGVSVLINDDYSGCSSCGSTWCAPGQVCVAKSRLGSDSSDCVSRPKACDAGADLCACARVQLCGVVLRCSSVGDTISCSDLGGTP